MKITRIRVALVAGALAATVAAVMATHRHAHDALANVAGIVAADPAQARDCAAATGEAPVVLLILGQSNAANRVTPKVASRTVTVIQRGRCYESAAPLPGATGSQGSPWPDLVTLVERDVAPRRVALALLAVDSTTIDDWADATPLRERLLAELAALQRAGIAVSAVLWQQGEADARAGTSSAAYEANLVALIRALRAGHVAAPVLLARSTRCLDADGSAVRAALARVAAREPGVAEGPDTDLLSGPMRADGCHWSSAGAAAAARLWAPHVLHALRSAAP